MIVEPVGRATRLDRDVTFHLPDVLKATHLIIATTVRRESERLLQIIKRSVETRPEDDDQ